ncbi:caspase domain-containing protein, partial [Dongia mobilis]
MLPRHGLGFDGRHIPGSIAAWFLVTLVACLAQLVQGGLSAAAAQGEAQGARVALVMGNGAYDSSIGRLKNPVNDAELMADTLRALGFKVRLVTDADQKEMKKAVRDFGADLMAAGSDAIGLFYYAGHGVQVDGVNYLLPVGAQIEKEGDVEIEAVSAQSILAQMEHAPNNIDLVFLDACRNNPMTRSFRSGSRGLARVDAPRGSFVGYSTAPGDVSVDGNGDNSPYTLALAAEMRRPGASIEEVHRSVRIRVLAETNNAQTPWDSSSLTANVVLMPAASAPSATAAPAPTAAPQPAQQP